MQDYIAIDPIEKLKPNETLQDLIPEPTVKPRRTRTPKSEPKSPPQGIRSVNLEKTIAAQLVSLNFFVLLSPWKEDALNEEEIFALAKALNNQAQSSPRFKKALEMAMSGASSGELLGVVMMIIVRRAARHNMIPPVFGIIAGGLLPENEETNVVENPQA